MSDQILLSPYNSSHLKLKNRIAMAPLTRCRAGEGNTATELMAKYYEQRSGAGLIVSEGSQISPMAVGYPNTPGIHSEDQVEAWKKITEVVHEKGSKIFIQLWHVGRISHPYFLNGALPHAPSAIKPEGKARTEKDKLPYVVPKAMSLDDIHATIKDFSTAAKNAMRAGFDGVEIHGANGYLINQFLCDSSNIRKDLYGGNIENRSRFGLEIVKAVVDEIGSQKTAIRLSPGGINNVQDSNAKELFSYFVDKLNTFELAYLHLLEPYVDLSEIPHSIQEVAKFFRPLYKGTLMINNGFTQETANQVINDNLADLVSFGKLFISNPDLVHRFAKKASLNDWDLNTFYSPGEKGYTDYPFL